MQTDGKNHVSPPSGRQVVGSLRYLAPINERPFVYCYDAPGLTRRSNYTWDERALVISDARARPAPFTWDHDGISFLAGAPLDIRLGDHDAARERWYAEACRIVKSVTKARFAMVFDHTFRKTIPAGRGTVDCRPPVEQVHVDGVDHIAAGFVRQHWPEQAELWLAGHWQIINLWRPLDVPASDWPLAFCDGRVVSPEDLVATDLLFPEDRIGLTYQLNYRPSHRWHYFPDMAPGEMIMFKCHDSRPDMPVRFVPHSAFRHPEAGTAPARRSIELRIFAYLGDLNDNTNRHLASRP